MEWTKSQCALCCYYHESALLNNVSDETLKFVDVPSKLTFLYLPPYVCSSLQRNPVRRLKT